MDETAPPPRALPVPELNDDVTAEILLRVAPDEPALLFRASAVCKLWRRIVSDPGFLRRYRAFHRRRPPPLLGFFYNLDYFPGPESSSGFVDFPAPFSRFVSTTAATPFPDAAAAAAAAQDNRRVSRVLDCRHGRVLFEMAGSRGLAVWDPIADDWTDLPPPGIQYAYHPTTTTYCAVLLAVGDSPEKNCRGGRFLVVCIGWDEGPSSTVYACVYSSEDRAWQAPVSDGTRCFSFDVNRPAVIGDGIYCVIGGSSSILKYDLLKRRFSRIAMPCSYMVCSFRRDPVLLQNEDGSLLGVAGVKASRLYIWYRSSSRRRRRSREEEKDAKGWVQRSVVDLRKHLPLDTKHCVKANVIGFAEGVGVFIIRTDNAGVFTLELKSRRAMKVSDQGNNFLSVVPFVSLFTPGGDMC